MSSRNAHEHPEEVTEDEREVLIDVLVMTRMSDFAGTDVSIISDAATDILKKFTLRRPVQGVD